jgi:tetratricopeptide (TPR) repeat protein
MSDRRLKDRDVAESVFRLKALTWSLTGMLLGALLGSYYALQSGRSVILYAALFAIVVWAVAFFGTLFFSEGVARMGGSVYFSSGSSTPAKREYSLAESYVARGQLADAAAEYERNASAHPDDPEPPLRLARLHRDSLRQPQHAVTWFRHALAVKGIAPGVALLTRRELIELYIHHLHEPQRALPELARIAELHPNSPDALWAKRELAELKRQLHAEDHR